MDHGDGLTPETYPHERCDASADDLVVLRDRFLDEDDGFGEYTDGDWPPTDESGLVYPIYFTPDDLDGSGYLRDERGNQYNPFAGNRAPTEGEPSRCNAPLDNWRLRYPEIRFCAAMTQLKKGHYEERYTYCPKHKNRAVFTMPEELDTDEDVQSAEEHLQTGLYNATVDHFYEDLGPWERLLAWGGFESLMGESTYEFAPEPETREFDFSEADIQPDGVDEDGTLRVACHYPTDYPDRALSLYVAAMMTVQMISVQPKIMATETNELGEETSRMMESRTIEAAQLTSPTENDPSQEFRTLETWSEHHLNLPFSRLIRDRPKLLEYGGVNVDPEVENDDVNADDIVLEIQADGEDVETADGGTDPNAYAPDTDDGDYRAESEKIVESARDSSSSSTDG